MESYRLANIMLGGVGQINKYVDINGNFQIQRSKRNQNTFTASYTYRYTSYLLLLPSLILFK